MNGNELMALGLKGKQIGMAKELLDSAAMHLNPDIDAEALRSLKNVIANPDAYESHIGWGPLARELNADKRLEEAKARDTLEAARPYVEFGRHLIPESAREQMEVAMRLPISRRGALMPDAHKGYGLPIGGVLETEGAVIPYGVGVDIGCSVMLTVLLHSVAPPESFDDLNRRHAANLLITRTSFGRGCEGFFEEHAVLDDPRWQTLPKQLRHLHDTAVKQLGSSGGGNHFVEFGYHTKYGADRGPELALMSHFGSRGVGAQIAGYYTKLAEELHPHLTPEAKKLAWLDLNTEEGRGYWDAMELAAAFAQAGHELTHKRVLKEYRHEYRTISIFNTHNLAWKDHLGRVVHRKGATPAGLNQMGIIPSSMATPAYLVSGLGEPYSLSSASHGAGRVMGRREAERQLDPAQVRQYLETRGITKIGAGIDEAPQAYKDGAEVIAAQSRLVRVMGEFQPMVVRMAEDDFSED